MGGAVIGVGVPGCGVLGATVIDTGVLEGGDTGTGVIDATCFGGRVIGAGVWGTGVLGTGVLCVGTGVGGGLPVFISSLVSGFLGWSVQHRDNSHCNTTCRSLTRTSIAIALIAARRIIASL